MLKSRIKFKEEVFKRDSYKCVNCAEPAIDAHHILERKLFPDGGYYLDNGASLCADCHLKAEMTLLSCEEIRIKAGIKTLILPPNFNPNLRYDKWGNIFVGELRLAGDLFEDEGQQKILKRAGILWKFIK